ncbi:16S rRNA (guanine1207-N2)-methyltransferase [Bacilli bacterium PM5-3]|nr:16S rRNA (guanine1207-N2)-methyltransferase [Bacilli bacterium PM5-3]MDH6603402.1 16S rRNA (guanine1207-N2)-methyltransferase [Bacilli bacterium PM5-9]
MKQYFEENSNLIDSEKEIEFNDEEIKLKFKTNSGLFSKDEIDEYSIKLVENIEGDFDSILDFGCGYGFIGIYLASKYNTNLTFIDITSHACEYTKINCEYNKIENYTIIQSDGIECDAKFDLITLNPPIHAGKEKVYQMYQQALEHLTDNGSFYIVIHKKHGAKSTIDYLKTLSNNVEVVSKKKSLYIIKIKKNIYL